MLKDIVITKIPVPKNKPLFEVQGLTLQDLGSLIEDYREPLGILMESKLDIDGIAKQYPDFIAVVIAIAAGEPEQVDVVKKLPFMTQLTALEAVWDLTIPDYAALGKLVERIKGTILKLPEKLVSK